MERKHSPLPWSLDDETEIHHQGAIIASVMWPDDFPCLENCEDPPTEEECLANAAFIVRAANNHYPLLEACKKLTAALEVHGSIPARAELIQAAWEEAVKAIADAERE